MLNQFLEVRQSKTGKGVFTKVEISAGVPIIEVTGELYTEENMPDPNHPALLQVGHNTFIGPSGSIDDYFNHSCNPNCKIQIAGNRAIIYSLYIIPKNNELTFDYSTTATDTKDKWQMQCQCGDNQCRQIISGHHYLPEDIKSNYIKKGMLPLYILKPNMFLNFK